MKDILENAGKKMAKSVDAFKKEISTLRAGRAVPSILDKVMVSYYNNPTPLNQLATISAPEPRLLVIQPWDKNILGDIEKAILKSDLGLTPNNDGSIIRLAIPQLTEERRKELVKTTRKKAEEARVAIRNIRREANDLLKAEEKKGNISEDNMRGSQEEVQDLTNKYIEEIDRLLAQKEKDIMEV
ncbi:MAG TPA: ribosome recycling factor [Firmicutes bacterium]|jgi:ribosome recycling factor|nr:ribosome recycling factor [Bacillota bacterium]HAA33999.1 ribosome recycling factor [Bacillota bacterium]